MPSYTATDVLHVHGLYSGTLFHYGIVADIEDNSTGGGLPIYAEMETDGNPRYGMYTVCTTKDGAVNTGTSYGLYAIARDGLNAYAIYATASSATNNYAGYFSGDINVTGTVVKGADLYRIDHPTDPANKYLNHSVVESPDMMNVYNGNVKLDASGEATVELPEWFEALNKDFRYQLTCIGGFAQVYIAEEISGNQFKIAGGKPGFKISWQVTGISKDAFANAHRIQVEEYKQGEERGRYLHAKELGFSEELEIGYEQRKTMEDETSRLKRN